MKKTQYVAQLYDGHVHIERRVYEDEHGYRCVKLNGIFFKLGELGHWKVWTYYNGNEPVRFY